MSEHPLVLLLRNSGDKPYRKLVEHHLRRSSIEQLKLGGVAIPELLPENVRDLTIEFIDAVNNGLG